MKVLCMDNASNNKKVQKIFGAEVDDMWCLIHTSQLAVGDLFKDYVGLVDVAKVIEKCQTLAVKSRKKDSFLSALVKACHATKTKFIKPVLQNATRWNSKHDNLVSVLRLKVPLQHVANNDVTGDLASLILTPMEFEAAAGLVACLEPLKIATKLWEKDLEPTLHLAVTELYNVKVSLEKLSQDANSSIKKFSSRFKDLLEKRIPKCGTQNKLYRVAHLIDPQSRGVILQLPEFSCYDSAKEELISLCRKYEPELSSVATDIHPDLENIDDDDTSLTAVQKLIKRRRMSGNSVQATSPMSKAEIEFSNFENMEITEEESKNGLQFFADRRERFPILSRVYRDIMSIPVSSASSERAFSIGKKTATPYRANLDQRKVEVIILKLNTDNVREYMEQHDISVEKVNDLQHNDNRSATAFTDMADVQGILSDTDSDDDDTDIEDNMNDIWS